MLLVDELANDEEPTHQERFTKDSDEQIDPFLPLPSPEEMSTLDARDDNSLDVEEITRPRKKQAKRQNKPTRTAEKRKRFKATREQVMASKIGLVGFNGHSDTLPHARSNRNSPPVKLALHPKQAQVKVRVQRKERGAPDTTFQDCTPTNRAKLFNKVVNKDPSNVSYQQEHAELVIDIKHNASSPIQVNTGFIASSEIANYTHGREYEYRIKLICDDEVEYSQVFYRIEGGSNKDNEDKQRGISSK
jgi:hypothetical protein